MRGGGATVTIAVRLRTKGVNRVLSFMSVIFRKREMRVWKTVLRLQMLEARTV